MLTRSCAALVAAMTTGFAFAGASTVMPGNDDSFAADMSPDGRYVAFASVSSNLVANDTNGALDIFRFDRNDGSVKRVSESVDGSQGNGPSTGPSISADGRYVAFSSSANNLVAGDTNDAPELFVKDLVTGALQRLNKHDDGSYPGGGFVDRDGRATISNDGATVAYRSVQNFTTDSANNTGCKIYAVDRATAANTLLVRTSDFDGYGCTNPRLSGNGQFVVFVATTDGLIPADNNGANDTFRVRLSNHVIELVSIATTGNSGNGTSGNWSNANPVVSDDGRYVFFRSNATDLTVVPPQPSSAFLRDMTAGVTTEVPTQHPPSGTTLEAQLLGISPDGRFLSFNGISSNGDQLGTLVYDTQAAEVSLLGPATFSGDTESFAPMGSVWSADNATFLLITGFAYPSLNDSGRTSDAILLNPITDAVVLASRASLGQIGDGHSRSVSISDAGDRIAFASLASNLVPGDTNGARDIFVRSTDPESLILASASAAGVLGNDESLWPAMTRDGASVAFISRASNLTPGDTNGQPDVFVKTIATGAIERVTNGGVRDYGLAASADGRYLAFGTYDASLFGQDPGVFGDQFVVLDRVTKTAKLASRTPEGDPSFSSVRLTSCELGDGPLALSGDGRFLMFNSFRPDIIGLPIDLRESRVFVYDRIADSVEQVDVGAPGASGCGGGISADGQRVAFFSYAQLDNTQGGFGAYVRDRTAGTTRLAVNLAAAPYTGSDGQAPPAIDPSGRYVLLPSSRAGIEPGDTNQLRDIFLADTTTGVVSRESLTASWGQANGASASRDSISTGFGQNIPFNRGIALGNLAARIAFASAASNLTTRDDNASDDIFLVERSTKAIRRISAPPLLVTDEDLKEPAISADASHVVAVSTGDPAPAASAKLLGDKFSQIEVVNWDTGAVEQADVSSTGLSADGSSKFPSTSSSGALVAFSSDATNLGIAPDTNGTTDVFVRDLVAKTTYAVTQNANDSCGRTTVAQLGDKYQTAFECTATNLVAAADTNGVQDIFVATQDAGIQRASVDAAGVEANGPSSQPTMTSNGRFVAYSSLATNLVGGDNNGVSDIYLRDLQGGTTTLLSVGLAGAKPDGASGAAHIVPTGAGTANWIAAYESEATNLVVGDDNGETDIFVRTSAGTSELISNGIAGAPANGRSFAPSVSPDGRWVTFTSAASNLVPTDLNGRLDVFLYDRETGSTRIISVAPSGEQSNDYPLRPAVGVAPSGDPLVVWDSPASNLTANDDDNAIDLFRRDAIDGVTEPMPPPPDQLFASGFE